MQTFPFTILLQVPTYTLAPTYSFSYFWTVNQGVYSRTNKFDGNMFPILTVQDVFKQNKPPGFWLNIQVALLILFQ